MRQVRGGFISAISAVIRQRDGEVLRLLARKLSLGDVSHPALVHVGLDWKPRPLLSRLRRLPLFRGGARYSGMKAGKVRSSSKHTPNVTDRLS
jgi:hypothetical protein